MSLTAKSNSKAQTIRATGKATELSHCSAFKRSRATFPRFMIIQCLASIFLVISSFNKGVAAEFRLDLDKKDQMIVVLEGPIVRGDLERFKSVMIQAISRSFFGELIIALNSPGGDVSEAIKIGKLVRRLLATTHTVATEKSLFGDIPSSPANGPWGGMRTVGQDGPNGRCWSACTLIFASGVIRQSIESIDKTSNPTNAKTPTVGVHRPKMPDNYFSELTADEAQREHADMLSDMSQFLLEMGADEQFVKRTMATSSSGIDLIPTSDLEEMIPVIEPFFADWISAKCGNPKDVLDAKSHSLYQRYPLTRDYSSWESDWGFGSGSNEDWYRYPYAYPQYDFVDAEVREQVYDIWRNVYQHHRFIRFCRKIIVKTHQTKWMNLNVRK